MGGGEIIVNRWEDNVSREDAATQSQRSVVQTATVPQVHRISNDIMQEVERLRFIGNRLENHADAILGAEPRAVPDRPTPHPDGGKLQGLSLDASVRQLREVTNSIEVRLERLGA